MNLSFLFTKYLLDRNLGQFLSAESAVSFAFPLEGSAPSVFRNGWRTGGKEVRGRGDPIGNVRLRTEEMNIKD